MNEKNNKDIINYNTRKAKQGVGKIKKEKESEFFKPKGTLEININEILTSQQVLINTFNTAKYANTQPFVFNPTFLKESFLKNTPNNNKINDFIIPIECKGDDGEIPEIEPILFEKNKQKFSTITHSSGKLLPKPKSISSHFKREIKDIGSPLISDEHDVENINGAKKNRMLISKNTNFINSIQELIINKQVNKYKLDIKLKRIKGQKIHWYLNSFKDHRTKNIG